jgi:hypothetical protein
VVGVSEDKQAEHGFGEARRVGVNIRVDLEKYTILEQMRKTGFGFAMTERVRSDVYNEVLGYGLQTLNLRQEMGERDFEKLWRLIHKLNWKKLNMDSIEKMASQ